ncbi:Type IV secretion system DNA-binding domain-containing protein (plasmid) [Rhodovastum atsumiense]|uniref:Type IV secretion system DNA-binding domain-containing protein n=1 Tax=Rhodovastum atsumiense TaxID=504468 RepID=A0A5M6IL94_9PROT|nr:type IV secretion system DNA-binding domain-containing protein [Rhodovastum atsumiense]KAA5608639.1 type IV secretion system DNA-binding domain-containing protein [Rhodovastum atsumiense]CAH2605966.1 Type IV secretion system DNA-binding domain-containing protein [Rhodovastum atsumiense]
MNQQAQHIADDVSRGVGLLHLRLRIQLQSLIRIVLISLAGFAVTPLLTIWALAEKHAIAGATWWKIAAILCESNACQRPLHPMGDPRIWPAGSIISNHWFTAQATAITDLFWRGVMYGVLVTPILALCLYLGVRAIGSAARDPYLLRGRSLTTDKRLADDLIRRRAASDLAIGTIPLVLGKETQHILMAGTVGAGKTQAMYRLLDQIRARGDIAILYDIAGAYIPSFYRPELGDRILNPLDRRSASWSPWAEINNPAAADRLAASLIPSPSGPNQFFSDAARAIFSTGLRLLQEAQPRTVLELFRLLVVASREEKQRSFAGTEIARFYDPEAGRTAAAIDVTAANYIRSLRFLRADAGSNDFSLSDFVRSADQAIATNTAQPWLFISSRRREHDALRPLITCLLDTAIAAALSLPENLNRRIWIFLDELDSLQQLPSLAAALQEGRKYGICVVAGLQDLQQLMDVWGKERGEAILSMFNTAAIFRLNSNFSAEYMSRLLGEAERERTEESARYGAHMSYESLNLGTRRDVERVVLPTDIMTLPDLHCYVRLPGAYPVARTRLPDPGKTARPKRHAPFEEADLSGSVSAHLRTAASLPADTASASTTQPAPGPQEPPTPDQPARDRPPEQALTFAPAQDGLESFPQL